MGELNSGNSHVSSAFADDRFTWLGVRLGVGRRALLRPQDVVDPLDGGNAAAIDEGALIKLCK